MKRLLLFTLIAFNYASAYSQSTRAILLNPNVYRTRVNIKAARLMDKNFSTIYNDTVLIQASNKSPLDYKIINEDENGHVILRVLPKVKITKKLVGKDSILVIKRENGYQTTTDSTNGYRYFLAVKKDAFKPLGKTLLATKIVGIPLVHPFKLRPSSGAQGWDLTGEFTASYNFGIRLKLGQNPFSQNFFTIIPLGFGVGAAKYFKENPDGTLTEKADAFAFNYYQGGILFTLQKVNFGLFSGLDAMIDKKNDWYYQSKPWFSIGLGYKFKND